MVKISNFSELSMDSGSGVEGLLNQILDTSTKDFKRDMNFSGDSFVNVDDKIFENGEKQDLGSLDIVSEARNVESGNENEIVSESSVGKEDESSKKRKRKCYSDMIKWILQVARDPYNSAIGEIPEIKRWKYYGNEHLWKQVLLVRETMLLKRGAISSAQPSNWQNKQMQPAMYEDRIVRSRRKIVSVKESYNKSSIKDNVEPKTNELWIDSYSPKCVPLGPRFQVDIPDWDGESHGSDSKWLGNKIWPLELHEQNKFLIERERIGKGGQDSCGCKSRGSFECIRFHIAEKRKRVKLELGPAFYRWKFDNIGEKDVSLTWNKAEEMKFNNIVKSNGKCFWNQLIKAFPRKDRESLVSYYFNVYLLQRRAYQNRTSTSNIDTDDEEELGSHAVKPRSSIFCSPKKVCLNFR